MKEEEEAEERKKAEIAAKQKSVKIQKKMGIEDAEGKERMMSGSTSESSGVSGPRMELPPLHRLKLPRSEMQYAVSCGNYFQELHDSRPNQ